MSQKLKKVNWHFIQNCNFRCSYCFIRPLDKFEFNIKGIKIIDKLSDLFDEINIVGGEPTISDDFDLIIERAKSKFSKVSLVTNGFNLLNNEIDLSPFSSIGISIDFFDKENNKIIGRANKNGESLDINDYIEIKRIVKESGCAFKVNLMVSKLNFNEDFTEFLTKLKPERLKIIAIMDVFPDKETKAKELQVSNDEFQIFVDKHNWALFSEDIVFEGPGEMINAYYMVDGEGEFLSNDSSNFRKVGNILDGDTDQILKKVNVENEKFNKRY